MKVFVSWSGDVSRDTASALRRYLPCMLQGLTVFTSQHDLESGARWGTQLASELEETSFGIICLTGNNQTAPWVLYEAGALTKLTSGRACGLLLNGLTPANVSGPLGQFQHRQLTEDDFFLLVRDLNQKMSTPLPDEQLRLVYGKWWPDLASECAAVAARVPAASHEGNQRTDRELLEEILERVRSIPGFTTRLRPGPDANVDRAELILRRILLLRPHEELVFLQQFSRLSSSSDTETAVQLANEHPAILESLLKVGLLVRDEAGRPVVNVFLSTVLDRLGTDGTR